MAFYRKQETIQKYEERNEQIIDLYLSSLTQREIGKKFNMKQSSVSFIVRKYNIKYKRNRDGENNSNWKGGVMYDKGRKLIYSPEYPNPDFLKKYCYEYRLIMEKSLGRYLEKDEIIHHINGDVTDNRIENLQVMKRKKHIQLHIKQGDMKREYKSKFSFDYDNREEYNKQYNEMYIEKNKEKLVEYRKNKWKNMSEEERKKHNKQMRDNYRRKRNEIIKK